MIYNLEGRTKLFSSNLIIFLQTVERNDFTRNIISQLIRSGTSIGVNYFEANGGCSRKEFKNRISICLRETKETKYWIELLAKYKNVDLEKLREIWKEANEFSLIFGKIYTSLNY
jgi:four helix bundle protein